MANKQLEQVLDEILREIRNNLKEDLTKKVKVAQEKIRKKRGLGRLIAKQERLGEAYKKLSEELRVIKQEYDKKFDKANREKEAVAVLISDADEYGNMNVFDGRKNSEALRSISRAIHIDSRQSFLDAVIEVSETNEFLNYIDFQKLDRGTRNMFSLAVSAKEKRGIILGIQTRNWRSLGISLPALPHLDKFDIKDGRIMLPTKPMLPSPKES